MILHTTLILSLIPVIMLIRVIHIACRYRVFKAWEVGLYVVGTAAVVCLVCLVVSMFYYS